MTGDPAIATQLTELAAAIEAAPDPRRATPEWKQVHKLLDQAGLPAGHVTHVVASRDLAQLNDMIAQLGDPAADVADEDVPDEETCRKAFRAFCKRVKVTVLDEQSKLGRGPLSKGANAGNPAIVPPIEWPEAVWRHLVRQGKLRDVGHGFYERADQ
ncbi:MAG: hypothetical protein ACYTFO_00100 [Planctomycetota bacterium]|jgi:hypothetical protein